MALGDLGDRAIDRSMAPMRDREFIEFGAPECGIGAKAPCRCTSAVLQINRFRWKRSLGHKACALWYYIAVIKLNFREN
jgi:hypothetical protein